MVSLIVASFRSLGDEQFVAVITKGDIFDLTNEVEAIEQELEFLNPAHWYESRRVECLHNRLDEIAQVLAFESRNLALVSSSSGIGSSVAVNSAL